MPFARTRQFNARAMPICRAWNRIVVVTAKDITDDDRQRLNGDVVWLIQKGGLDRDSVLEQLREQIASLEPRDR